MQKESFKKSVAKPVAELIVAKNNPIANLKEGHYVWYLGKVESNQGNALYWFGSHDRLEEGNRFFNSFNEAITFIAENLKPEITFIPIDEF